MEKLEPLNGWLLYDGSCGFCTRWVPFWEPLLTSHGYAIEKLQTDWVKKKIGEGDLLSDIRILRSNGTQVIGADVYRDVMRKVWWLWPLYVMTVLPLFRSIFDGAYKIFKKNRFFISTACGLPNSKKD